MTGDQQVAFEDLDLVGQAMDLDQAPARGVGHGVVIALNANHPLTADPPFEFYDRPEQYQWQALQHRLFFAKGFVDDAARRCMDTRVGDSGKPACELLVQIIDVAKDAAQETVFADIAERALDLAFCLGSIRSAGLWQKAVVTCQIAKTPVVDDDTFCVLPDDGSLHPVIEDLARHAADRLERSLVTRKDCLQCLAIGKAAPDQS